MSRITLAICAAALLFPALASAGDSPILVVRDWGVGEIDGKIMFYTGPGRYVDTPIPAPPHGPRWDAAYRATLWLALGTCSFGTIAVFIHRHRRRQYAAGCDE